MDELTPARAAPDILLLAAHPNWRESRVNRQLLAAARRVPRVVVHDLYGMYPDYDIDVLAEQARLEAAALVVLLHPIQWYSMPALQKLWFDDVLQYGWAYGRGGEALAGKDLWLVATTGGSAESYGPQGYNGQAFDTFLPAYRQTAALCGMRFLPPLLLHGARRASDESVSEHVRIFGERLQSYPHWAGIEQLPPCRACEVPSGDRPGGIVTMTETA